MIMNCLLLIIVDHGIARIAVCDGRPLINLFERFGGVPIPPYLKRDDEEVDQERYQTVFAELPGSVAAPTASLNMTPELLEKLRRNGVDVIALHCMLALAPFCL